MNKNDKIISTMLGLAIADAIGVPYEFKSREIVRQNPATDMIGYGTYNLPPGTWSDDTSMALCLLDSLSNGIDYKDIMNNFVSWLKDAKYTATDTVFDVGIASSNAIYNFMHGKDPILCGPSGEYDNGNGAMMRILPLAFYIESKYGDDFYKSKEAIKIVHNVVTLTHGHIRNQLACSIYLSIATLLINDYSLKDSIEKGVLRAINYYKDKDLFKDQLRHFSRITKDDFSSTNEDYIKGSGYVVHSLEASIYCLLNTDNYKDCVLKAVNLGEDTDTTAAIAGGLAGLYYKKENIPPSWIEKLAKKDYIINLSEKLGNSL